MEFVDLYLKAVRPFLPRKEQDDILRELSEDIYSRAADREAELGRSLSDTEQQAVLRHYGHPALLASRFRPKQPLIGAPLLPFYWQALKISLIVALAVNLIANAILVATGRPADVVIDSLARFPLTAVTLFGWVTLAFMGLDAAVRTFHPSAGWDPRTLKTAKKDPAYVSRVESAIGVAFGTLFVFWCLAVPQQPFLLLGPAAEFMRLAPVWHAAFWPIVVFSVGSVVLHSIDLVRPYRTAPRIVALIALNLGLIVLMGKLLSAESLVVLTDRVPVEKAAKLTEIAQIAFRCGLVGCAIGAAFEAGKQALRLYRCDYRRD